MLFQGDGEGRLELSSPGMHPELPGMDTELPRVGPRAPRDGHRAPRVHPELQRWTQSSLGMDPELPEMDPELLFPVQSRKRSHKCTCRINLGCWQSSAMPRLAGSRAEAPSSSQWVPSSSQKFPARCPLSGKLLHSHGAEPPEPPQSWRFHNDSGQRSSRII